MRAFLTFFPPAVPGALSAQFMPFNTGESSCPFVYSDEYVEELIWKANRLISPTVGPCAPHDEWKWQARQECLIDMGFEEVKAIQIILLTLYAERLQQSENYPAILSVNSEIENRLHLYKLIREHGKNVNPDHITTVSLKLKKTTLDRVLLEIEQLENYIDQALREKKALKDTIEPKPWLRLFSRSNHNAINEVPKIFASYFCKIDNHHRPISISTCGRVITSNGHVIWYSRFPGFKGGLFWGEKWQAFSWTQRLAMLQNCLKDVNEQFNSDTKKEIVHIDLLNSKLGSLSIGGGVTFFVALADVHINLARKEASQKEKKQHCQKAEKYLLKAGKHMGRMNPYTVDVELYDSGIADFGKTIDEICPGMTVERKLRKMDEQYIDCVLSTNRLAECKLK